MSKTGEVKRIYFVRHGETDANLHEYVPSKTEPLNATGISQSQQLTERVSHIEFEKIFTSDFTRAQDTARAISEIKNLPMTIDPAFGEVLEPSSLFGVSEHDERVRAHRHGRNGNVENPEWRMEDAENFSDIFKRVATARNILKNDECAHILVASHGFFMQLFAAAILLDAQSPTNEWFQVARTLTMSNTGVTMFTVTEQRWKLVMWNDHAHFAE